MVKMKESLEAEHKKDYELENDNVEMKFL